MKLVLAALIAFAAVLAAIVASAFWYAAQPQAARGDAILVFGAGMAPDGTLDRASRLRVARAVALYREGAAPLVIFSGGPVAEGGVTAAGQMIALAVEMGLPVAAALAEGQSYSTLQNAWYSARMLEDGARVIAVTEGFHMARALLAMKWAGIGVAGYATSTPLREGTGAAVRMTLREGLAWGYNLGRMALWTGAGWVGVSETTRVKYLR